MRRLKWLPFGVGLIIVLAIMVYGFVSPTAKSKIDQGRKVLTVYTWLDFIPSELQKKFEQETGIKLHIDYMDSDEALEAKLLTGKSEYDLVYPSTPYVFRHINLGLFQELDIQRLPNLRYIDSDLILQFQIDKKLFSVPYLWGSSGFAYDVDAFEQGFPRKPIDSWAYLFDPEHLKQIAKSGVAVTSSANEFFVAGALWKGKQLSKINSKDIEEILLFARDVRPLWTAFLSSDAAVQALVSGEVVVACIWSGDAAKAKKLGSFQGRRLHYVVPKEGALKWVDSLAIPHNARNVDAAHKLINFLLDPKHMAMVTNVVHFANTNAKSKEYIDSEIVSDQVLYPSSEIQQRLILDRRVDPKIERTINRYFFKILVGY